jgi:hypothetical protein
LFFANPEIFLLLPPEFHIVEGVKPPCFGQSANNDEEFTLPSDGIGL